MSRFLLGSLFATAASALPVSAQVPVTTASGVGSFGGRVQPATPALMAPRGVPIFRPGFHGIRPPIGPGIAIGGFPNRGFIGGGFGGGFISGTPGNFYYGGYYGQPYFVLGPRYFYDDAMPPPVQGTQTIALSNEFPATLTLQFPAAAKVWLNGASVEGDAATERTLSSPVLKQGETFTFHIKARWSLNGQEYEYTRDATVDSGQKSRLLVVSGTPVK